MKKIIITTFCLSVTASVLLCVSVYRHFPKAAVLLLVILGPLLFLVALIAAARENRFMEFQLQQGLRDYPGGWKEKELEYVKGILCDRSKKSWILNDGANYFRQVILRVDPHILDHVHFESKIAFIMLAEMETIIEKNKVHPLEQIKMLLEPFEMNTPPAVHGTDYAQHLRKKIKEVCEKAIMKAADIDITSKLHNKQPSEVFKYVQKVEEESNIFRLLFLGNYLKRIVEERYKKAAQTE